jgi:glyoxylase-like metal-dependent hydrolase (beta-lactamase superfamily II)
MISRSGGGERPWRLHLIEPVPGVRMLERTWGSNIYLTADESPTIIDAGFPLDERRIVKALGAAAPALMIATHYHIDHVGPMHRLKDRYGALVAAHGVDADVMEGSVPYQVYKLDLLRTVYYKALSPLYRYEFVQIDRRLAEGDVLEVMGGLEVIHLPGHTDGSIALYQRERGILFSGDTIRNEKQVLEGPPPQFSPRIDEAFKHIREKVLALDFEVLLPGHGEPVTRGARDKVERMMWERGELH